MFGNRKADSDDDEDDDDDDPGALARAVPAPAASNLAARQFWKRREVPAAPELEFQLSPLVADLSCVRFKSASTFLGAAEAIRKIFENRSNRSESSSAT